MTPLEERLTKGMDYLFALEQEGKMGSQEYQRWFPEWLALLTEYRQIVPKPPAQTAMDL